MNFSGSRKGSFAGGFAISTGFECGFFGEFVVVGWWNCGFCLHDFWVRKFSSVLGFIFWVTTAID